MRVSQPSQDDIGIATLLGEYAEKGPLPWITGVLEVKLEITAVESDTANAGICIASGVGFKVAVSLWGVNHGHPTYQKVPGGVQ